MPVDSLRVRDQLVEALGWALDDGKSGLAQVPIVLKRVLCEGAWRERRIKTGEVVRFERFEAFVSTPPLAGLGGDLAVIRTIVRDDPEALDLLDQATVARPGGDRKSEEARIKDDNVNLDRVAKGNARQYALRRLRKSAPEVHARVLAGEISAHAGMVEAGFRARPTPLDLLERAWKKASQEERLQFLMRVAGVTP